jgi:hypothetical protein
MWCRCEWRRSAPRVADSINQDRSGPAARRKGGGTAWITTAVLRDRRRSPSTAESCPRGATRTYLDVLIADEQYHQASTNDLQATAGRYQDTVALYVALGGGW